MLTSLQLQHEFLRDPYPFMRLRLRELLLLPHHVSRKPHEDVSRPLPSLLTCEIRNTLENMAMLDVAVLFKRAIKTTAVPK